MNKFIDIELGLVGPQLLSNTDDVRIKMIRIEH